MKNIYQSPSTSLNVPNEADVNSNMCWKNIWGMYWRALIIQIFVLYWVIFIINQFITLGSEYLQVTPTIYYGCVGAILLILNITKHNGVFSMLGGLKLRLHVKAWKIYGYLASISMLIIAALNILIAMTFEPEIWVIFKFFANSSILLLGPWLFAWLTLYMCRKLIKAS